MYIMTETTNDKTDHKSTEHLSRQSGSMFYGF